MKKILAGLFAFLAFSTVAPLASADPPSAASAASATKKSSRDYEYTFPDDALLTDTMGAAGAKITILKRAQRSLLLRPRVQFVQEMLKSVENM